MNEAKYVFWGVLAALATFLVCMLFVFMHTNRASDNGRIIQVARSHACVEAKDVTNCLAVVARGR